MIFSVPGSLYAVLEEDGSWVSALRLAPVEGGWYLEALETDPEQRRRGYAAGLIEAVQTYLGEGGKLYSHVDKRNLPSLKTHEKCGFRRIADVAVYVDGSVNRKACTMCWDDKPSV